MDPERVRPALTYAVESRWYGGKKRFVGVRLGASTTLGSSGPATKRSSARVVTSCCSRPADQRAWKLSVGLASTSFDGDSSRNDRTRSEPVGRADEDTRNDFAHGGWATPYADEVLGELMGRHMAKESALLFGRRTYSDFASFVPPFVASVSTNLRWSHQTEASSQPGSITPG